ncbi:MAG: hypothetical protein AAB800_04095 [Patescibacteria group bacterium]
MNVPEIYDGSTSGGTQQEIHDGHNEANLALIHAEKAIEEGTVHIDPEAHATLIDFTLMAKGGTD